VSAKASQYDRDFYAWCQEQAELLRAGKADQADLANVAEEIESIGKGGEARARQPSHDFAPASDQMAISADDAGPQLGVEH
jgi:Domain of unknown function DUF29